MERKTSIIILSYNTLDWTRLCIESIRRHTAQGAYEIIVVDNGSKDGSVPWLLSQPDVRCIPNEENMGFPKGCNQGLAAATGTELLLLNSDALVMPRWLDNLRLALHSRENVGAVGCVTNYCGNDQMIEIPQEANSDWNALERFADGYSRNDPSTYAASQAIMQIEEFADGYNRSDPSKWEPRPKLVMFCFLMKREAYERIGTLDEQFTPGNYEDDDYSLRLLQAGYDLLLCRDTFIFHAGSRSFVIGEDTEQTARKKQQYFDLLERNRKLFEAKWHLPEEYMGWTPREVRARLAALSAAKTPAAGESLEKGHFLSVVVVTWNRPGYLRTCIGQLRAALVGEPHELLVVDNGMDKETRAYLAQAPDIRRLPHANQNLAASYNQGIRAARGDLLLLMHNDAVLTGHSFKRMRQVLLSRGNLGAVGPLTNRCRIRCQFAETSPYKDIPALEACAEVMERTAKPVEWAMLLQGFCVLMRRSAYEQAGAFDERFPGSGGEMLDYSLRLIAKGWRLAVAGTLVHHDPGSLQSEELAAMRQDLDAQNNRLFEEKWNVRLEYSFFLRHEFLQFVQPGRPAPRILEVGCACGANLMALQMDCPGAKLYGIELDADAARIAANFADVRNIDVEALDMPEWEGTFDYIIAGDVLEHLRDPWKAVRSFWKLLRADGKLVASVPNVLHISNLQGMLDGRWEYTDMGILDRTHLRFFTRKTLESMLEGAGFRVMELVARELGWSQGWQDLARALQSIPGTSLREDEMGTYQWVALAAKRED